MHRDTQCAQFVDYESAALSGDSEHLIVREHFLLHIRMGGNG